MKCKMIASLALLAAPLSVMAQSRTFAFDLRGDDSLFSFPVDDPSTITPIGPIGFLDYTTYAMDFNTAGTTLYVVNHMTVSGALEVGTVNLSTGAYTAGAAIADPAPNVSGMSVDPTDETFYLCTTSNLYTLNPATGATSLIGTFSGLDFFGNPIGLVIDIAVDSSGQMYGHDISNDALWSIDKTTAVATHIGYTNLAANFAQGMDFDPATDELYVAVYTGGGTGVYGTFNLTTGEVNTVLDLLSFPNAEVELEIAIRAAPSCPADWNGDGNLLTNDFVAYLNDYNAVLGGGSPTFGDPDIAAPIGVLNTADLIAFLNFFNAGCG